METLLIRGNRVKVYQKPYTREEFEGEATLLCQAPGFGTMEPWEMWYVKFSPDDPSVLRKVHSEDVVK